jgi:RNA-splicing ligase RtcB
METFADGMVRNWASILDEVTKAQAETTATLPILAGPIALMPDAHFGWGATVGSVIATESAVIPSAVGVDIGCGMAARRLDLRLDQLGDDTAELWVARAAASIPAGLGHWHEEPSAGARVWFAEHPPPPTLKKAQRALIQLGTLGSGNHFVELASDADDVVWILLHSGSRGGGNQLATLHTNVAKKLHAGLGTELSDPELAWLQRGTAEFDAYVRDLGWAQAYARENRSMLLDGAHRAVDAALGRHADVVLDVNCHHNYTELEEHGGRWLWVTRKGAIRAGVDDWGLIPGSMGQTSFVVRGLGNPMSYESCSHGAGRTLSRTRARKTLSVETLADRMSGLAWQASDAVALLDEHPEAYKPLEVVMHDQADLVRIEYELKAIANYKGVS